MRGPIGAALGGPAVGGAVAERSAPGDARVRVLRLAGGRVSLRWRPRTLAVGAALAGLAAVLVLVALVLGDFPLTLREVLGALLGADGSAGVVVRDLRLPRALAALGVGAALAVSGALFQTLVRNPLGSPELIGFTQGAAAGAVAGIVLLGTAGAALAGSALAGGVVTAVAVYLLAVRHGLLGARLVLVGIAVGAMLNAVTWWLLTRAELATARTATVWLVGSLNARGWEHVALLGAALLVLGPLAVVAGRALRVVELGDDVARGLGLPLHRTQLLLVALAVAAVAVAVAVAGPVPFVALVAPQVARRLVRGPGIGLGTAALVGAVLLLGADLLAQHLLATALPVGVMTGVLGGVYLAGLLRRDARRTA